MNKGIAISILTVLSLGVISAADADNKVVEGAKKAGGATVGGVKKVGSSIKKGAEAVGHGAKKLGSDVKEHLPGKKDAASGAK